MNRQGKSVVVLALLVLVAAIAITAATAAGKKEVASKNSEASVTTNENGSVSRTFTEYTVTTNGTLVTEHRRETRTNTDTDGNVLETSTSEYAQSYSVGDVGMAPLSATTGGTSGTKAGSADSFLGVKFGEEYKGTNLVADADEPTLMRATFKPKKALAGFDDYYLYVTPKTHKVVKIFACAKEAVEPGARWRRHYLVEALEKRYGTWARLCSYRRPCYAFDIGSGRYVTACLAGASRDYETVVAAWDDTLLTAAADEHAKIVEAERKAAAERRSNRVSDAAAAF